MDTDVKPIERQIKAAINALTMFATVFERRRNGNHNYARGKAAYMCNVSKTTSESEVLFGVYQHTLSNELLSTGCY